MGKTSDADSAEIGEPSRHLHGHQVELQTALKIDLSVDLIEAAKQQLSFLRAVDCVSGLHRGPAVVLAVKRYYKCWMPIAAQRSQKVRNGGRERKSLLPPFDVQWVWHCHRLNPVAYREFCTSMYERVIDFPILGSAESEAAARERCKRLWLKSCPKEPFDVLPLMRKQSTGQVYPIEEKSDDEEVEYDLVQAVARQSSFYFQVSQPYMWEDCFLRVALHRYKCFLHILRLSQGRILCVPTYDIDLIWHAHQLAPVAYANDTEALLGCVVAHDDTMEKGSNTELGDGYQDTVQLWERTFGLPYERAGSMPRGTHSLNPTPLFSNDGGFERVPVSLTWNYHPKDVNANLKVLSPRYVLEVCILIGGAMNVVLEQHSDHFFRLRTMAAHKLMKLDIPFVPSNNQSQWQKLWLLQCEVSTGGLVLELRCHKQRLCNTVATTKLLGEYVLTWQELQEAPLLSIDRFHEMKNERRSKPLTEVLTPGSSRARLRLKASITPPVAAPYLLKSVSDRVTDNSGAMISRVFLKRAKNQPQQGRWMSRTVLDHTGKECFVIRIRAAKGIWRKGSDRPVGVDWNERVIQVCEGGWTYISGFIGLAPEKIIASATPIADDIGQYKLKWSLSSGEILTISRPMEDENWERNLNFTLDGSPYGVARLLNGRKLAYEVPGSTAEDEEGFVTVVRHSADAPQGKATALFNWKVSAMEVHCEEDVLLVLLLCTAIVRSVADLGGMNYGNLFARRRAKEVKAGVRDWGSVVLENPKTQSNLKLWYVNTEHLQTSHEGSSGSGNGTTGSGSGSGFSSTSGGGSAWGSTSSRGMTQWDEGKSFAESTSAPQTTGFGGGIGGMKERRTGSGVRLDGPL